MTLYRWGWPAVAVAGAASLGLYAAWVLVPPGTVYFGGDQARLFEQASDLLHGHMVYTGPYSKGDRFHPGPAYFFLIAAAQLLSGGGIVGTTLITSAIKALTVAALSLLTYRLFGSVVLAAAAPFTVAVSYWFVLYLKIEWNPAIVLPFFALGAWAALEAAAGSAVGLVTCVLAISVAVQSHLAVAPPGAVLLTAALGAFLIARRDGRRTALWATGLAAALLWLPAAIDAVRHRGGNAWRIVRDLGATDERQSLAEAWTFTRGLIDSALPFGRATDELVLALSAVALAAGALWWRGRRPQVVWLTVMLAGAWGSFVWSVLRIPGEIENYYLIHLWIVLAVTLAGGAGVLVEAAGTTAARKELAAGVLVAAWCVAAAPSAHMTWLRFSVPTWNPYPLEQQLAIIDVIEAREPARRALPIDYYPAFSGFGPSFDVLLRRAGYTPQPHRGIGAYRVLSRREYDALGGAPVDGGQALLENDTYVLEFIPTR